MDNVQKVQIEVITPTKASTMLGSALHTRAFVQHRVEEYKRCFEKKEFISNAGNPISLTVDERLIEGRHRLEAIRQLGKNQRLYVARNVPTNAAYYAGNDLSKSIEDRVALLMGRELFEDIEGVCRTVRAAYLYSPTAAMRVNRSTLNNPKFMASKIEEHKDKLNFVLSIMPNRGPVFQTSIFRAALLRTSYVEASHDLQEFCGLMLDPSRISRPVGHLFKHLMLARKASLKGASMKASPELMGFIERGIYLFCRNVDVERIRPFTEEHYSFGDEFDLADCDGDSDFDADESLVAVVSQRRL